MKKLFVLLVILISTTACSKSEKSALEKQADLLPCELLTDAEIKDALSIPSDAETSIKQSEMSSFANCFYKWESVTWQAEVISGYMTDFPAELAIVLAKNVNVEGYKQSVTVYKDGQEENGIGEMATWGEKMTQLTFLYKGMLFHVHAKISADAASNKAKAIKVAKLIISKL